MNNSINRRVALNALMLAVDEIGVLDGDDVKTVFNTLPSVDAVEVVRCNDCKYYDTGRCVVWDYHKTPETGFCYEGVKK